MTEPTKPTPEQEALSRFLDELNKGQAPEPEEMCLFTADGFTGELIECNEGDLQWMDKKEVLALPTWEGDAIFLKLLIEEDEHRFFTLRLVYEGSKLVEKQLYRYS